MATRLYPVATTAAPISPAFDGAFIATGQAVRRSLATSKDAATETVYGNAPGGWDIGDNAAALMLVTPPLNGAHTVSGTWSGTMHARELNTTDNIQRRQRKLTVYSNDGTTVRGGLVAFGQHFTTTEWPTTFAGVQWANGATLSSVSALDGDRIVIEMGPGASAIGTTPEWEILIGGSGTDHLVANGDATGTVGWVEFSATLSFQAEGSPAARPYPIQPVLTAISRAAAF